MSLGGNYLDLYKEEFKGILDMQIQQEGSLLGGVFHEEKIHMNQTTFHKQGKKASQVKQQKGELRVNVDSTFEERNLSSEFIYSSEQLDIEELGNIIENPRAGIIMNMMYELGRQKDDAIITALGGNQVVIAGGVSTNTALTLSVAVNDHTHDSTTGDVGLTVSKILVAETAIKEAHGARPGESLVIIAPFAQLAKLAASDDAKSRDFHTGMPLSGPGVYSGLQGLLGHNYIAYEETGLDGNDDEKVFVCTRDALFVGIKRGLEVETGKNPLAVGFPEIIEARMEMGVARRDEGKVCVVACDPA